eukprot:COSAG02_NODE_4241_length_5596_cov_4.207932_5_plen_330_part_00
MPVFHHRCLASGAGLLLLLPLGAATTAGLAMGVRERRQGHSSATAAPLPCKGGRLWNFATGDVVRSSPAVGDDGTVYVGSNDQKLYAVTPDWPEGRLKWSFATGGNVNSSPAVGDDGTVYVGSEDQKLYAVTPEGQLKWSFATGGRRRGPVRSSPAVGADGTVYVGSVNQKLYAVTPEGQLKWSFHTGSMVDSSPAVGDDGTVYVGSDDQKLYAVVPVCGGCAATELCLCGPTRTDPWTCLSCMAAHETPLRVAGCGMANATDFCSHALTPCALALGRLCAGAKTNSSVECTLCCGEHQQVLKQVRLLSRAAHSLDASLQWEPGWKPSY